MRFSHSRIETFKTCPKKFYYQYIEKPEIEEKTGIEAFLGSMVHLVLEKLYKDLKFTKLNSLEELLDYYDKEWNNNYNSKIEIVKEEYTQSHYKSMGVRFITEYYNKYKPFDTGKTLGLEMQVDLKFLDDSGSIYQLLGYIDRLTMITEEHFEIHDYKTNAQTKTQEELDKDNQLALYTIAIKKMYPSVKKIDLVWHFLESGLEMRSKRTDSDLENLKKEIIESIKEIEKKIETNDFPAKESALCNWCNYKEICPVKNHLFFLKKLPKNEYLNEKGAVLVSKYLELSKKKKELTDEIDPELEKIKEALLDYSKKNNSERIYDTKGNSILVKEYKNYTIPEKGTTEREGFDNFLKKTGVWELIADINSFSFSKAVTENILDPSFLKNLEKYIKETKTLRFYTSSKK